MSSSPFLFLVHIFYIIIHFTEFKDKLHKKGTKDHHSAMQAVKKAGIFQPAFRSFPLFI